MSIENHTHWLSRIKWGKVISYVKMLSMHFKYIQERLKSVQNLQWVHSDIHSNTNRIWNCSCPSLPWTSIGNISWWLKYFTIDCVSRNKNCCVKAGLQLCQLVNLQKSWDIFIYQESCLAPCLRSATYISFLLCWHLAAHTATYCSAHSDFTCLKPFLLPTYRL